MKKITLKQMWSWVCPECTHQNYAEGDNVDASEVVDEYDIPVGDATLCIDGVQTDFEEGSMDGVFMMMPNTVLCNACLGHFETE